MKRLLFISVVLFVAHVCMGQKLEVVDEAGNKVALATIVNENGVFLGYSELDGQLPDLKDSKKLFISHVAYQPVEIGVADIVDNKIVLKDAIIRLNEVTVASKPIIRIRKYYRAYVWKDSKMLYFRNGLVDYYYNKQTHKQQNEKLAKFSCSRAPWGTILNLMPWASAFAREDTTMYQKIRHNGKYTFKKVSPSLEEFYYKDTKVGTITLDEAHSYTRIVRDLDKEHALKADGETKKKQKERYSGGRMDSKSVITYKGTNTAELAGEDLLSKSTFAKMDGTDTKTGENYEVELSIMEYTLEVEYLTEEEAKAKHKEKFPKLDQAAIEQFALSKGVPPLNGKSEQLLNELKNNK